LSKQTSLLVFFPKFRLDKEDVLVAFFGKTAHGDLG
tara:strand:- start:478 stop:585 length:108 start_codon:yes stop_codon:yes gene_type:complete